MDPITDDDVTNEDARRAGFESRHQLLTELCRHRGDQLYRIAFRLAGDDPRIALRNNAELDENEIAGLMTKLERLDAAGRDGPWTGTILNAIAAAPGTRAGVLAEMTSFEKEWLKTNIRKLKELGLTESLQPGYRLSPRGMVLLKHLQGLKRGTDRSRP